MKDSQQRIENLECVLAGRLQDNATLVENLEKANKKIEKLTRALRVAESSLDFIVKSAGLEIDKMGSIDDIRDYARAIHGAINDVLKNTVG